MKDFLIICLIFQNLSFQFLKVTSSDECCTSLSKTNTSWFPWAHPGNNDQLLPTEDNKQQILYYRKNEILHWNTYPMPLLICTLFRWYLKEYLFIHQKLNSLKSATTQTTQDVYLFSKISLSSGTFSTFPFIIMKHIQSFFLLTLNKEFFKTKCTSFVDKTIRTSVFCLPFYFCFSDLQGLPSTPYLVFLRCKYDLNTL